MCQIKSPKGFKSRSAIYFVNSLVLHLLFVAQMQASTAETLSKKNGKVRYAIDISVPVSANSNHKGEEYICTTKQLSFPEESVYLTEFIYNFGGNAHHFLLYGCKTVSKLALDNGYWPCAGPGKSDVCTNRKHIPLGIPEHGLVETPKYSKGARFPDGIAYGIGRKFDINYLVLEVHLVGTKDLRNSSDSFANVIGYANVAKPKFFAGTLGMAGVGFRIPPGRSKFSVDVNCQPHISQPIYPFGYWVHTHDLGYVVSGYKVNKTTGIFTELARWTHHWPQPVVLSSDSSLVISPGDYVAGKCTYNSSQETSDRSWGPQQRLNEMCNLFIFYYTASTNPEDLSITCVNKASDMISKTFPSNSDILPEITHIPLQYRDKNESQKSTFTQHSEYSSLCNIYKVYGINDCPFLRE